MHDDGALPGQTGSVATGRFVVFEGIDGSGKSTLASAVAQAIRQEHDRPVVQLREPTDLPSGQAIRKKLAGGHDLPQARWLELFLEDRLLNLAEQVRPALARGELVLQDRYFYSTAAYQGSVAPGEQGSGSAAGSERTAQEIVALHEGRGCPAPDLLVFLDIDPAESMRRIQEERGQPRDVFETREFLEHVRSNYERILPPQTLRLAAGDSREALVAAVLSELR